MFQKSTKTHSSEYNYRKPTRVIQNNLEKKK